MWIVAAVAFVGLLIAGANHPAALTRAQRIANLENVLKCPSCADASLAQSETVNANQLKATIASWVAQGLSDQTIESRVVGTYGSGELLRPTNSVIWIVPVIVVVLAVLALGAFLLRQRGAVPEISAADEERVLALLRGEQEQRGQ